MVKKIKGKCLIRCIKKKFWDEQICTLVENITIQQIGNKTNVK